MFVKCLLIFSGQTFWIGGKREDGKFYWIHNKERLTFTNWAIVNGIQQPDNYANTENCTLIGGNATNPGGWEDHYCGNPRKFICKSRISK